jgi:hypothetical protein
MRDRDGGMLLMGRAFSPFPFLLKLNWVPDHAATV